MKANPNANFNLFTLVFDSTTVNIFLQFCKTGMLSHGCVYVFVCVYECVFERARVCMWHKEAHTIGPRAADFA